MSDQSGNRTVVPATIQSGGSLSGEVTLGGKRLVGIIMPTGWDAAGLAFQALISEPSALPKAPVYGNVTDQAGAAIAVTVAASVYVALAPTAAFLGLGRILVRSGTNAAPVNQTANRTIGLVVDDI